MDAPTVRPVKAGYWNLFRPWTLHGAVVPVLIGGAVASTVIEFGVVDVAIFILILIGACLFQSVANILNTYGDFKKGTDTVENETRSPELVTGVLSPHTVRNIGLACIVAICAIGLILILHVGWGLMIFITVMRGHIAERDIKKGTDGEYILLRKVHQYQERKADAEDPEGMVLF